MIGLEVSFEECRGREGLLVRIEDSAEPPGYLSRNEAVMLRAWLDDYIERSRPVPDSDGWWWGRDEGGWHPIHVDSRPVGLYACGAPVAEVPVEWGQKLEEPQDGK